MSIGRDVPTGHTCISAIVNLPIGLIIRIVDIKRFVNDWTTGIIYGCGLVSDVGTVPLEYVQCAHGIFTSKTTKCDRRLPMVAVVSKCIGYTEFRELDIRCLG